MTNDNAGRVRHTFRREYVPENPGSFLDAHKALMQDAMSWAFSITTTYNLNMKRGEFAHEVLPPSESKTPGRRMLALTVQFYSFHDQATLDSLQANLRRLLHAQKVGGTNELTPHAGDTGAV